VIDEQSTRLKDLDIFAGVSVAVEILSAPSLKLFLYLFLNANRKTGRIEIRCSPTAKCLKRGERKFTDDLDELERKGVCNKDRTANQHKWLRIEICDRFWPYVKGFKGVVGDGQQGLGPVSNETGELASPRRSQEDNSSEQRQPAPSTIASRDAKQALEKLLEFGIAPEHARIFAGTIDAETVLDTIEYVRYMASQAGNRIRSRQSMLVYYLREAVPIPVDFVSSRRRNAQERLQRMEAERENHLQALLFDYEDWCHKQAEIRAGETVSWCRSQGQNRRNRTPRSET
jgi:hypothetical protein